MSSVEEHRAAVLALMPLLPAERVPVGSALGRVLEGLLAFVLEDPARNRRDTLLARARELA